MRHVAMITLALMLPGCMQVKRDANRIGENIRADMHATAEKFREYMKPPEKPKPRAVPPSYCYKALQDVLCYAQPMPGWETRLVGYQGTDADTPPPLVMELLPETTPPRLSESAPVNRVMNAKPVFISMPPEVQEAEDDGTQVQEQSANPAVPDGASAKSEGKMPDPAPAPQSAPKKEGPGTESKDHAPAPSPAATSATAAAEAKPLLAPR